MYNTHIHTQKVNFNEILFIFAVAVVVCSWDFDQRYQFSWRAIKIDVRSWRFSSILVSTINLTPIGTKNEFPAFGTQFGPKLFVAYLIVIVCIDVTLNITFLSLCVARFSFLASWQPTKATQNVSISAARTPTFHFKYSFVSYFRFYIIFRFIFAVLCLECVSTFVLFCCCCCCYCWQNIYSLVSFLTNK